MFLDKGVNPKNTRTASDNGERDYEEGLFHFSFVIFHTFQKINT